MSGQGLGFSCPDCGDQVILATSVRGNTFLGTCSFQCPSCQRVFESDTVNLFYLASLGAKIVIPPAEFRQEMQILAEGRPLTSEVAIDIWEDCEVFALDEDWRDWVRREYRFEDCLPLGCSVCACHDAVPTRHIAFDASESTLHWFCSCGHAISRLVAPHILNFVRSEGGVDVSPPAEVGEIHDRAAALPISIDEVIEMSRHLEELT